MSERFGDWLGAQPYSLAMSSGFFSFYAHTGMLESLLSTGQVPTSVSGSSAGALVGGAWAAGIEPRELGARLQRLRRDEFWDPALGLGLLRGRKFDRVLREMLPVEHIERARVPVAISAFDIKTRATHVLRDGALSAAIRASCAVPALFHPVSIGGRAYWDGGILDRPGLAGVPDGERVLFHHIASKSPWRTKLAVPRRPNMVTLVIEGLPRSGPFKLDAGRRALELAREATLRALDVRVVDGVVSIDVSAGVR
jgi:NTE family protein